MELVCDVFVLLLVFGNEAYDFIVYFVARAFGTGLGSVLSGVFGSNWIACWAYLIIDTTIVLVTMLNPFLIASFPVAIGAVFVSSAVGEAKAKCAGSAASRTVQWLIGALGNQVVRIVTNVLGAVNFKNDVKTIVEAARQTVSNVVSDVMVGMAFQLIDEKITGYFAKMHNKLVACFIRVCIHGTIAKMIEQTSAIYSKSYLRMLVPKWMNIAAIGVGNSKAKKQAELIKKAKDAEGKQALMESNKLALKEAEGTLTNYKQQMESARAELQEKQKDVGDIEKEMSWWASANDAAKQQSGRKMEDLQRDYSNARQAVITAETKLTAANSHVTGYTGLVESTTQNVGTLSEEVHKAREATAYKKLRHKASTKAIGANEEVHQKKRDLETAEKDLGRAQDPTKQSDPHIIAALTGKVDEAKRGLEEARRELHEADAEDRFAEATKRRDGEVNNATTKVNEKKEEAKRLRESHKHEHKPDAPENITQRDQKEATRLENEAAEIEREYDVNPSWSTQIFGWLAQHWKFSEPNAEQTPQKPGSADQNSQNPEPDQKPKTKMGSYV
jgi:hypothetical protein